VITEAAKVREEITRPDFEQFVRRMGLPNWGESA
jgi:hypothetical protein